MMRVIVSGAHSKRKLPFTLVWPDFVELKLLAKELLVPPDKNFSEFEVLIASVPL